jgi:hypothetical protein
MPAETKGCARTELQRCICPNGLEMGATVINEPVKSIEGRILAASRGNEGIKLSRGKPVGATNRTGFASHPRSPHFEHRIRFTTLTSVSPV